MRCPHCQVAVDAGARFCSACGAAVAARDGSDAEDQTRLLTVLFADLSGSVAATHGLDPEDAVNRVNQALDLMARSVTEHGGRVDRYLGDGLLAIFGAPRAREDDSLRAISAAIGIRDAIGGAGLAATVGINTGEVYVGRIGGDAHREFSAMGPVVNLAARLQAKAEPGQVLIGEATYRLARRAFGFSPHTLQIKGVPRPVVAYAVGEPLPRPELARGIEGLSAELTGRTGEIARLVEALEGLGPGGGAVAIVGEAGVGKSRLLSELRSRSETREGGDLDPLVWLEGRCFEGTLSAGYGPFVDLLRSHFAWGVRDDPKEREARVAGALTAMVSAGSLDADRAGDLEAALLHLLAAGGGTPRGPLAGASPELIRDQIFRAVRDLLRALAGRRTVVVVLDDLHWADTLSIELAASLLDDLESLPVFLLCAYRPEGGARIQLLESALERLSAGRRLRIDLRPLSSDETGGMLASLLGGEALPETWRAAILEKAQGNPLFVEEVVRSLVDGGRISRGNGGWRVARGLGDLEVPATIQGIVQSRVDRLSEPLRGVLQRASVIGRVFGTELLSAVAEDRIGLDVALRDLEEADLIYLERVAPEEQYSFRHVFTRDTVYRNLLKARRAALHRDVGEAIERLYADRLDEHVEALAHHFERSADERKAAEYLVRAGEKATAAYSNEEAFAYLERGLERLGGVLPSEDEAWAEEIRRRAQVCLGDLLERTGRHDEAIAAYRGVLAGMGAADPPARARLLRRIGASLQIQRRFPESLAAFQEALDALAGTPPAAADEGWRSERLDTVLGKLMLHYFMAAQEEVAGTIDRHRDEFLAHGSPLQRGRLYNVMAVAGLQRERYVASSGTVENARRAWETIEPSGVLHEAGHARFVYGFSSMWAGRLEDAERELAATLALAERIGDLTLESRCVTYLALTHRKRGDVPAARRYARRALEVSETGGMTEYLAAGHAHLAWVANRDERWDEAEREGRIALELWEQIGGPYRLFLWMPVWPLLGVDLAGGRLDEAARHARILLDPERQPMPEPLRQALEDAASAAETQAAEARALFSNVADLARPPGYL